MSELRARVYLKRRVEKVQKMSSLNFAVFAAILVFAESKPSPLNDGNACIAEYLKEQGKLEEDFVSSGTFHPSKCTLVMPLILTAFERALELKLSNKSSINSNCVIVELKKNGAMDYMLKQELLTMTKSLDEEETKIRIEETKENLRMVFEEAAKKCDSDPSYGGLFDDILEIRNESLAVLQQNYCYTKYVIENKLIDLEEVDVNPKRLAISNIECEAKIASNRIEKENKLRSSLELKKTPQKTVECIMEKFQSSRAFDSNLALEVIDQIDASLEDKRRNREKIAGKFQEFITSMFSCMGVVPVSMMSG